jgi:hypothetical protein
MAVRTNLNFAVYGINRLVFVTEVDSVMLVLEGQGSNRDRTLTRFLTTVAKNKTSNFNINRFILK